MPPLPRLDEVLLLPAPAERTGVVGTVVPDVFLDFHDSLVERIENRVFEPGQRELGEISLDGVHPGRRPG